LQNNKWYATQYSSSHDIVRMNANTAGGLDIYNQTDGGFANVNAGSYNVSSTTVIDSSRNLTNIASYSGGALAVSGQSVFTGAGSSNTYQSVIKTVNSSSDQWGHITLSGAAGNSVTNNYYLIGRGSSVADRQMSFHIPTASNYGSGSQPKFRFASSGSDTLMTIEASTGNVYVKGNLTVNGTTSFTLPATAVVGNSLTAQPYTDLVTFNSNNDGNSTSGDQSSIQIYNGTAGEDAFIAFHVSADYAGYFGLDGTTNDLFWGGWSVGNNKHRVFHAGNSAQFTSALNTKLAGIAANANAYSLPTHITTVQSLSIRGDQQTGYSGAGSLGGLTLWGASANTTSQIMFKPTSSGSLGNHGFCTDSYNTYFIMDTTNRGWVFRNHTTSSNIASISNTGGANFSGTVQIGGTTSTTQPYSSTASGARLTFGGSADIENYSIGTNMENIGGNYTKLDIKWHTGIRMGAQQNYGGVRIFDSEDMGTLRFSVNNGSANTVVNSGDFVVSAGEISSSNYAVGTLQNGALNLGRTDTNYAWSGTSWASDIRLGMLLNCSETYEIGVHDSGDSVDSFMKYNGTDFEMGNNLGWGTTTFAFASSITAGGNITAYASDERLKENIKPIDNALEKVMKIRGVEFDWTDEAEEIGFEPKCKHETGVIAQEIEEVIPDAIAPAPFNKEYKTVEKDKIVALLIEAVKEQQKQIEELKEKLESK